MVVKGGKLLRDSVKERVICPGLADLHGQPAHFLLPVFHLTAQNISQQLVAQADAQDGRLKLQCLAQEIGLGAQEGIGGIIHVVGRHGAAGEDDDLSPIRQRQGVPGVNPEVIER